MAIKRKFTFNGQNLPDPDPAMNPDDVRIMYASQYPELLNAGIVYNDPKERVQEYGFVPKTTAAAAPSEGKSIEFKSSIGKKG